MALRTVSFLGAGVSDYGDVLYSPGREDECVSAVWSVLSTRQDRWHVLDLQELRSGSALLEGRDVEKYSVCPVLDLGAYPESMDHKHRTDLHRAQNKIRKHPEVEFAMAAEESLFGLLEEFLILYAARWGKMDASIQAFHREVAARFLASGDLRLCALRIDKVPAAAVYSFRKGRVLYCYLSGFEPAMSKLSPGAVLLNWLIEGELEAGAKEVDFLRKPEAYKYLWGARDRANYTLRVKRELPLT
jgi:CelD/BcsL family acetyltransferase involved in cellulose biosynthesis